MTIVFFSSGCNKDAPFTPNQEENTAGTHYRTITTSDGQERDFIVYVPASAAGQQEVPVLFVVHGTNQSGQVFYDNTNLWNPKADQEGFIVVYPTALVYCHYDNSQERTVTKWAAGDLGETEVSLGALPLCPNETLQDDMLFFDELATIIEQEYVIDRKRKYLTGFSNGAQMVARLAAQRSEMFAAATVHAGNLSQFIPSSLSSRPMSLLVSVGADDGLFLDAISRDAPIPVDSTALEVQGVANLITPFLAFSGLDSQYSYSGTQYFGKDIATFLFQSSNIGLDNSFRFILIEDLEHSYTNILIDPFWAFLESQSLP